MTAPCHFEYLTPRNRGKMYREVNKPTHVLDTSSAKTDATRTDSTPCHIERSRDAKSQSLVKIFVLVCIK